MGVDVDLSETCNSHSHVLIVMWEIHNAEVHLLIWRSCKTSLTDFWKLAKPVFLEHTWLTSFRCEHSIYYVFGEVSSLAMGYIHTTLFTSSCLLTMFVTSLLYLNHNMSLVAPQAVWALDAGIPSPRAASRCSIIRLKRFVSWFTTKLCN
jgi:hypothetical protein